MEKRWAPRLAMPSGLLSEMLWVMQTVQQLDLLWVWRMVLRWVWRLATLLVMQLATLKAMQLELLTEPRMVRRLVRRLELLTVTPLGMLWDLLTERQ